jgi:hypothetical protein
MTKPNLYLDVDGVFFALYGIGDEPACYQLRPYAHSFIQWASTRFTCKWLTCWAEDQLCSQVLNVVLPDKTVQRKVIGGFMALGYMEEALDFDYVNWKQGVRRWLTDADKDDRWADKIDSIDLVNEDFYWLEDGISERSHQALLHFGRTDRYLYVDERGPDGLLLAKAWLEEKLKERG